MYLRHFLIFGEYFRIKNLTNNENTVSLDSQLYTAAQLTVRARIFYDLWFFYEGADNRKKNINTMREYNEFFRFMPHALFVSFAVHMAALMENKKNTINVQKIIRKYKKDNSIPDDVIFESESLIDKSLPVAKKLAVLRNNLFAHRSASLSFEEAFNQAAVTPNDLIRLTKLTLEAVNLLLLARGMNEHFFNKFPVANADAMLAVLSEELRGQAS